MTEQVPRSAQDSISAFVEGEGGVLTATRSDGSKLQLVPAELDRKPGSNAAPRTGYQIIDSRPAEQVAGRAAAPVEPDAPAMPAAAPVVPRPADGPASSLNPWAGRTGESMTIPGMLPPDVHAELHAATRTPVHAPKQ